MKLKQWLYGVAALAMLAACSDKDIAPGSGDENEPSSGSTSSGYLAVQIKLPQDASTRAPISGGNDNFNDGTPNEYKVDNAMIIIFKGADEKSAKFCKAQDLKRPWFTNQPSTDQITSSYLAAVRVTDLTTTEKTNGVKFWGLVILNRNGETTNIDTDEDADVLENTEEVTLGNKTITSENSFQDVLDIITESKFLSVTGKGDNATYSKFFMTNAPLSNVVGGGGAGSPTASNIHYLVNLGTDTYETIEDARTHVENCIYVERAVAKVTCSDEGIYNLKLVGENGELADGDYKITATVKYALTNTNKKSYLVRNVDFKDNHFKWNYARSGYKRMVGELSMPGLDSPYHNGVQSFYRTYWCYDPNYSTPMVKDTDKHIFNPDEETVDDEGNKVKNDVFVSIEKPLYCKENTFDVKRQSYFNTTMAIFEVNFNIVTNDDDEEQIGDGHLYIKNEDNSVIYVSKEAAASQEIARIKNDTKIRAALTAAEKASGLTGTVENATQYLDIHFSVDTKNYLLCDRITLNTAPGVFNTAGVTEFEKVMAENDYKTQLINNVNNMSEITYYKNGVSYYLQPIMHFGKIHCSFPLDENGEEKYSGITTEDVYNGGYDFDISDSEDATEHARLYLGRYGMVRNNWYELNISNITALGSPKVPDINVDYSDDNKEVKKYIGVEIHVLSWAKRTQSVKF